VLCVLSQTSSVYARQDPNLPTYIVQSGDTLTLIAIRFGVTVDEILAVNTFENPDAIDVGTVVSIPGLDGITGQLANQSAGLGDTLKGLSNQYQLSQAVLAKLNKITSPGEIYPGVELIVPVKDQAMKPSASLQAGESLLETAVANNQNPWTVLADNQWSSSFNAVPGDPVYLPANEDIPGINPISPQIQSISVNPLPILTGETTEIKIKTAGKMSMAGSLGDKDLHFFESGENEYVAFIAIPVLGTTGLSSLKLQGKGDNNTEFTYESPILVKAGTYGGEQYVTVQEDLIDPEVIKAEEDQLLPITTQVTPDRYFSDHFQYPIDDPCVNGGFGLPRLYNGTYNYYHTGLDFSVCAENLNIYAAAPGKVVFAQSLKIKGNYTIIDHGWGIYTGYAHQSKFLVNVGDIVTAGQVIGEIGSTGRAAGPHLHFDLWVNGVYVNPIDWIEKSFP
jgi:murein DD-endopeptidase MepM/ murein hydrolase activator NlpD